MEKNRKDFLALLIRHFKDRSFRKGVIAFRYDGTLFPVVRINPDGIYYGTQPWLLPASNTRYLLKKIHLKRSLLGRGLIFEIHDKEPGP